MTRTAYRIGTDAKNYTADDSSGEGARITGGRWNEEGLAAVYTATSRALACLETLVHLNAGSLPLNRYLVEFSIPETVWKAAETTDPDKLVGWDALPAGMVSIAYGSQWLREGRSALLVVPSVVVPEEHNVIINPKHKDAGRLDATKVRKWLYDPRLGNA